MKKSSDQLIKPTYNLQIAQSQAMPLLSPLELSQLGSYKYYPSERFKIEA